MLDSAMIASAMPEAPVPHHRFFDLMSLVLEVARCQEVIDRVTTTLGYADLSVMHPENPRFHNEVVRSLQKLFETLDAKGQRELAMKVRSFVAEIRYLEASRLLGDSITERGRANTH